MASPLRSLTWTGAALASLALLPVGCGSGGGGGNLGLMAPTAAAPAPVVVTSATVTGNALTVTGTGLGTSAAPTVTLLGSALTPTSFTGGATQTAVYTLPGGLAGGSYLLNFTSDGAGTGSFVLAYQPTIASLALGVQSQGALKAVGLQYIICVAGVYPNSGASSGGQAILGQIIPFAPVSTNSIPQDWMLCDGRSLSIAQNTALFSLIGTTYGGNGTTTFNLPDLRGRTGVGAS